MADADQSKWVDPRDYADMTSRICPSEQIRLRRQEEQEALEADVMNDYRSRWHNMFDVSVYRDLEKRIDDVYKTWALECDVTDSYVAGELSEVGFAQYCADYDEAVFNLAYDLGQVFDHPEIDAGAYDISPASLQRALSNGPDDERLALCDRIFCNEVLGRVPYEERLLEVERAMRDENRKFDVEQVRHWVVDRVVEEFGLRDMDAEWRNWQRSRSMAITSDRTWFGLEGDEPDLAEDMQYRLNYGKSVAEMDAEAAEVLWKAENRLSKLVGFTDEFIERNPSLFNDVFIDEYETYISTQDEVVGRSNRRALAPIGKQGSVDALYGIDYSKKVEPDVAVESVSAKKDTTFKARGRTDVDFDVREDDDGYGW